MSTLNELSQAIQKGRAKSVQDLVPRALEEGLTPRAILEEGLLAGMGIVGEQFKAGAMFVPQVLMAAKAMNAGAVLLKPHLAGDHVAPLGRACLGTVKGDLHDIGKNLVRMMFEGQGIEVIDLGVDVSRHGRGRGGRQSRRHPRSGQDHGGRRAGHPAFLRRYRRRRLYR